MKITDVITEPTEKLPRPFSWLDYYDMPMDTVMSLAESYFCRNQNLLESNDLDSVEYFQAMHGLSDDPVQGESYMATVLLLSNDKILVGQPPTQVQVLSKLSDHAFLVRMPNGRETSFPWQEIRGQLVFDSFFFSDNQKYQKFQNAVALKFNTVLPDPESHTPRNLPT